MDPSIRRLLLFSATCAAILGIVKLAPLLSLACIMTAPLINKRAAKIEAPRKRPSRSIRALKRSVKKDFEAYQGRFEDEGLACIYGHDRPGFGLKKLLDDDDNPMPPVYRVKACFMLSGWDEDYESDDTSESVIDTTDDVLGNTMEGILRETRRAARLGGLALHLSDQKRAANPAKYTAELLNRWSWINRAEDEREAAVEYYGDEGDEDGLLAGMFATMIEEAKEDIITEAVRVGIDLPARNGLKLVRNQLVRGVDDDEEGENAAVMPGSFPAEPQKEKCEKSGATKPARPAHVPRDPSFATRPTSSTELMDLD